MQLVLQQLDYILFYWLCFFLLQLLQTFFYFISALNDVIGSNEVTDSPNLPTIRKLKDTILTSLAYPLSMFVGLTFWGLYMIDRELIFPRSIDPYFPAWLNHVMHTNIMVFIIIEMLITYRRYPPRKSGLTILASFLVVYLVWMHIVYMMTNVWVYPVMAVLNLPLRLCFFILLFALVTALYISGEYINDKIWSPRIVSKKQSQKIHWIIF